MGLRERTETYFRKRLKIERERHGWSQDELAKMLVDNGIDGVYASTIAKIETGKRAVRMDEAAGIADILGVSLDALLGRKGMESEAEHAMTGLADEAAKMVTDLAEMRDRLRIAYQDLEAQHSYDELQRLIAEGALWSSAGMDIEKRRALLMWAMRDSAAERMNELGGALSKLVACRTVTGAEVQEMWHWVTDRLGPEIEQAEASNPDVISNWPQFVLRHTQSDAVVVTDSTIAANK